MGRFPSAERPERKKTADIRKPEAGGSRGAARYRPYCLRRGEFCLCAALGAALGAAVGFLFYGVWWGCLAALPGAWLLLRLAARRKERNQRAELTRELRDYILSVTSFLRSGYALENAMTGAEKEIRTMHGDGSIMAQEAARMRQKIHLQVPPETLWKDFGDRCGLREGEELARVFAVAKRQGGDYIPILKAAARAMDARRAVREEIDTALAGQKLEYHIMCAVPAVILLYLDVSAPEMTDWLYGAGGHAFMTAVLLLYAAALAWGNRILEKSTEED